MNSEGVVVVGVTSGGHFRGPGNPYRDIRQARLLVRPLSNASTTGSVPPLMHFYQSFSVGPETTDAPSIMMHYNITKPDNLVSSESRRYNTGDRNIEMIIVGVQSITPLSTAPSGIQARSKRVPPIGCTLAVASASAHPAQSPQCTPCIPTGPRLAGNSV